MSLCAYLFVLEGLDQFGHPTEGHGESQMGAGVAVRHLDALVAEVSLPLCITADFILSKDVRYQVSCVKEKRKWIRVGREIHFSQQGVEQVSSDYLTVGNLIKSTGQSIKTRVKSYCLTFTAGWGEVVHQEAKEIVELQKDGGGGDY